MIAAKRPTHPAQNVNRRIIAHSLIERVSVSNLSSERITGKPEIMPDCGTDRARSQVTSD